jgi:hypothetical protein
MAPYQIIRAILLGEMVQNNKKTDFYAVFSHFRAILAPFKGLKKIHKGPQVGGMYGPMSELEIIP